MDRGKFLAILHSVGPIVLAFWPDRKVQRVGSAILNGMGEAEQIFKSGEGQSNKRPYVIAAVASAAKSVNDATDKQILPVEETAAAAGAVIDTIAKVIKVVDTAHAAVAAAPLTSVADETAAAPSPDTIP